MKPIPFAAVAAYFKALAEGLTPTPYESRGKGRGQGINRTYSIIRRKDGSLYARPIDRSKYMPHQGKRECARRAARASA